MAIIKKEEQIKLMMDKLREKAISLNGGIKLAVNRKKEDIPLKEIVTVDNFEFSKSTIVENGVSKESRFVALSLKEYPENFFFGGSVVTEAFDSFTEEETVLIKEIGIPVMFEKKPSKDAKHNDYTKVIFYPEDEE